MLLTCNSCRNTYVIDDATLQASGGQVLCEQCSEPLVPLQVGAPSDDKTTILDGYNFDNLESQWRKQQTGAMAGVGMAPPQIDPGLGLGEPPSALAAPLPAPTQALEPVVVSPSLFQPPAERTMALDLEETHAQAAQGVVPPGRASVPHVVAAAPASTARPTQPPMPAARKDQVIVGAAPSEAESPAPRSPAQVVVPAAGSPMPANMAPGRMQQAMPAQAVLAPRRIPGQPPPGASVPAQGKSKSGFLIGIVLVFVLLLVGGGVVIALLFAFADGDEPSTPANNESKAPASFDERIIAAKSAPSSLMLPPIDGDCPPDATLVVVNTVEGLHLESELAIPLSAGNIPSSALQGELYLSEFASLLEEPRDLPVILLMDQSLSLQTAFSLLYTAESTGREVLIGGENMVNSSLIGTLRFEPYQWPAPPAGVFTKPADSKLKVEIGSDAVTVRGKDVNPDGIQKNEIKIAKLPGAYDKGNLNKALSAAKIADPKLNAVRISIDSSLGFATLIDVALMVRGDYANPRFRFLLLEAPQ
jgi:predicted Zn finger-like uncharacterized protein